MQKMWISREKTGGQRDSHAVLTSTTHSLPCSFFTITFMMNGRRGSRRRIVEMCDVQTRGDARPGGIRFLGTTMSPAELTRAGASYAPERLYFALARYAAARRHRRHRLLPLLLLLLSQKQRYAGIDTDVTARADIDSDASWQFLLSSAHFTGMILLSPYRRWSSRARICVPRVPYSTSFAFPSLVLFLFFYRVSSLSALHGLRLDRKGRYLME